MCPKKIEVSPAKVKPAALMSMNDLVAESNQSRQWVYTQIKNNPKFPKPVKIGTFNIAFRRSEFDAWVAGLEYVEPSGLSIVERRVMHANARKNGGV